jgi:NAD(P)-dependent dehydrogenase (short-subunit alcohol dehydrogenase family)
MGVNFYGVVNGISAFLPAMIESGEAGHVVNTASMTGVASNMFGIYGVTKHAVVALSEYLYYSLAEQGAKIGASVLCPSFVRTNLGAADRNRPDALKNEASPAPPPPTWINDPAVLNARAKSIDTDASAQIVLDAIRESRFWIFTDREMDDAIRARTDGMLAWRNPGVTLT